LTTAASTTESTRVSTGNTVFLTMEALSTSDDAEREIPSCTAIHGRSAGSRNSGKLENPASTGTRNTSEKTTV